MPGHDMIVIGASAGGVEALSRLVAQIPEDLPATVCVVQHTMASALGRMAKVLDRAGPRKTNRALPDSRTCTASSGYPVSGPRYAIRRRPNAVE